MKKIFLILIISLTYQIGTAQTKAYRTPKNPKQADKVRTVDGSNGKYVAQHKVRKTNFAKNNLHIKKAKRSKEKTTRKTYSETKL